MSRYFDSHAHVDGPEFDVDRDEVMARAAAAGVRHMIVIGAVGEPTSAERAVAMAQQHPTVWATVGTHPHDVEKMTDAWWAVHERLAGHPRVVAVGETGLDYYYKHATPEPQREAFARFLGLARAVDKPVVCHIRDAHDDARAVLDAHGQGLTVIIHCFTGTPDEAAAYVERGYYVSFSGIVTYKNAEAIRAAALLVPPERVLIETDCPYLAPVPKRGRRNEPAFVTHTAALLAELRGIPVEMFAEQTFRNTCEAFRIPEGG